MNPFDEIRVSLKKRLQYQAQTIDAQIAEHESALADLRIKQAALPSQVLRASQKLPDNANCPTCWIFDGALRELTPLNGGKDFDRFRCRECGTEIEVPF